MALAAEKGVTFDNGLLYESKEKQVMALLSEEHEGKLLHQHQYQQQQQKQPSFAERKEEEEDSGDGSFGLDSLTAKPLDETTRWGH